MGNEGKIEEREKKGKIALENKERWKEGEGETMRGRTKKDRRKRKRQTE